ncbi:MAG: hypothetical protein H0V37_11395 [Chloroflexia bacterium]|nr:hypothetical protein [Chloroflexia bacterium]
MNDGRLPIITIAPEPTPEELAAIVSAIAAAVRLRRVAVPSLRGIMSAPPVPPPSRWSRQGRREAMRGLDRELSGGNGTQ